VEAENSLLKFSGRFPGHHKFGEALLKIP